MKNNGCFILISILISQTLQFNQPDTKLIESHTVEFNRNIKGMTDPSFDTEMIETVNVTDNMVDTILPYGAKPPAEKKAETKKQPAKNRLLVNDSETPIVNNNQPLVGMQGDSASALEDKISEDIGTTPVKEESENKVTLQNNVADDSKPRFRALSSKVLFKAPSVEKENTR